MDYLSAGEEEECGALARYVEAVAAMGKTVRLFKFGKHEGKEFRTPVPTVQDAVQFLKVADVSCYGSDVGIEVRFGNPSEEELQQLRAFDALKPGSHAHPFEPRIVEGPTIAEYVNQREHDAERV